MVNYRSLTASFYIDSFLTPQTVQKLGCAPQCGQEECGVGKETILSLAEGMEAWETYSLTRPDVFVCFGVKSVANATCVLQSRQQTSALSDQPYLPTLTLPPSWVLGCWLVLDACSWGDGAEMVLTFLLRAGRVQHLLKMLWLFSNGSA